MSLGYGQSQFHFIGIGGAGMSGLARILLEKGIKVSGSDINNSQTLNQLKEQGASIYIGHSSANIEPEVDTVVISTAIPQDNEELVAARQRGLRLLHRGDVLAQLMSEKKGIAIAGAHGKTTTTSMISLVLEKNRLDPTVVVGGEVFDIGANAKLGNGDYLVAEADESDGSFLKLSPHIAVVTNIENDHLDYWGTTDKIDAAFTEFLNKIPDNGCAVLCFDSPKVREIASRLDKPFITYGINHQADYYGDNIRNIGITSTVDVYHKGDFLGTIQLSVPGEHNITNAIATIAVSKLLGLDFEKAASALQQFTGVRRRFQLTGKVNDVTVVDDYAHHPTEIRATLKAAKKAGFERVIALFQPHRYTRTKFLFREFGESFQDADVVIISDIYSAGEKPIGGVTAQLIVDEAQKNTSAPVYHLPTGNDIINFMLGFVRPGDLVLTLGAGNIWSVGVDLVNQMKEG